MLSRASPGALIKRTNKFNNKRANNFQERGSLNMSTIELDSTSWEYASFEFCRQVKITPNRLAYAKDSATLIGVVKRSRSGDDSLQ